MNGIKDIHIGVIPVKSGELLLECLETGGGGIRVEFVCQLFGTAETAGSFISVEMNEGAEDRENVGLTSTGFSMRSPALVIAFAIGGASFPIKFLCTPLAGASSPMRR